MPASSAVVGAVEKSLGSLLNSQTTMLGNTTSKITSLMSPQQSAAIAPSIFSAGPQDQLVTQDIYGVTQGNPINNVNLLTSSSNKNVLSSFAAASGGISNLTGLLSVTPAGVQLNANVLTQRVQTAVGVFGGTTTQITPSLITSALSSPSLGTNQYPMVATNINGVAGSVSTANVGDVQGLINAVNAVTGNPSMASYMDVGASSALMSAVMREAITSGVPGVVPTLVSNAPNNQVVANALTANVGYAVQTADLETINTAATALGPGAITAQVPNAVPQILAGYHIPAGSTVNDYPTLATNLTNTLNTVNPGWDTVSRNGVSTSNLSPFVDISDDAKTVLGSQGLYTTEMAIASNYPSLGLVTQAKTQYPYMLVTPQQYSNAPNAKNVGWS